MKNEVGIIYTSITDCWYVFTGEEMYADILHLTEEKNETAKNIVILANGYTNLFKNNYRALTELAMVFFLKMIIWSKEKPERSNLYRQLKFNLDEFVSEVLSSEELEYYHYMSHDYFIQSAGDVITDIYWDTETPEESRKLPDFFCFPTDLFKTGDAFEEYLKAKTNCKTISLTIRHLHFLK